MQQKTTLTTTTTPMEKDFTPAEVEAYLDTIPDTSSEVGITCSGSNCLLARAAKRRFPTYYVMVHTRMLSLILPQAYQDPLAYQETQELPLSPLLVFLYQQFDALGGDGVDGVDRAISKGEWMTHWCSLVAASPFLQQYYGPDGRLHLAPPPHEEGESHLSGTS